LVATEGEPRLLSSTGLYGIVELELIVASDVTSAASLILQDAIVERQCQGTGGELALHLGGSDIDSGDLEGSRGGRRAPSRGRALSQRRSGEGEDSEGLHFQKINRSGCEVAKVVMKERLMNEVSVFQLTIISEAVTTTTESVRQ